MRWQCINPNKDNRYRHWLSKSMIYKKYKRAESRCKPNHRKHKDYYDRWIRFLRNNFEEFYNDMNESYEEHCRKFWPENTTLDRIDNNWHYCKENCRRATQKEQSRNRRPCVKVMFEWKEYPTIIEFCEITWQNPSTISTRINRDWMTIEEAIAIKPHALPKKWRQIEYKWTVYPSISAFCREKWININTIFNRIYRKWMSLEDAIDTL